MTTEDVAQYKCAPGKRMTIYYDTAFKNELLFRVMQTGTRTWLVECANALGTRVQRRIGSYPEMDLATARRECVRVRDDISAEGTEGVSDLSKKTLWQILEDWRDTKHRKDSTLHGYENILKTHAAEWLHKPLRLMSREWLTEACRRIAEDRKAPRQSDHLFQTIRALANHAKLPTNPAAGMRKRVKQSSVEGARPMFAGVMRALFDAIDLLDPYPRVYFYTMLFTGFRSEGALAMQWHLLKLRNGGSTYHLAEEAIGFKKGGGWEYPLHPFLAEELRKLQAYHAKRGLGSQYVYPSLSSRDTPSATPTLARAEREYVHHFNGSLARLRKETDMPQLRPNDFRDTVASYSMALFGKNMITEKLLDHRIGGTNVNAQNIGILYVGALPRSFDATAQVRKVWADHSEAWRPFVEAYGDALLMLAGRLQERDMSPYQLELWKTKVKPIFRVDQDFKLEDGFETKAWLDFVAQAPQMALNTDAAHEAAERLNAITTP
ncbi:integrase arm-type DNA-binding domain-containing protein [Paraburkholderia sp. BR10936]|uniref:integrase arm-type DNA-binding domain-containing protein n=1 Tax=Paraburkholderia sp. BR10936 TaxID=3236993 RepID=UPI0034D35EF9